MVEGVATRPEYLVHIARHMRDADQAEVRASGYDDMHLALKHSVAFSTHHVTFLADGEPCAVMGVGPTSFIEGTGAPWLLGTDALWRERRALMGLPARYIPHMLRVYPTLTNFVHAPNTRAVAWLQRIGFTMGPAAPHGPRGELFHRFTMKA